MNRPEFYRREAEKIFRVIYLYLTSRDLYPLNTRWKIMSFYDLIVFSNLYFKGIIKGAYRVLIKELKLFRR